MGEHNRGTRARLTAKFSLVELVRVSAVNHADSNLDECSHVVERRALATANSL